MLVAVLRGILLWWRILVVVIALAWIVRHVCGVVVLVVDVCGKYEPRLKTAPAG